MQSIPDFRSVELEEAAARIQQLEYDNDPNNFLWMECGDVTQLNFENKLTLREWEDPDNHLDLLVEMCRDTNYLHFIAKYILNIDLLPFQTAELQILFQKQFPMLIGSRGAAKSFIFAVYIILRSLIHQGCKTAVVGAAFRQSLVVFNYIKQIWDQAPILRDICSNDAPKRDVHMAHWPCGLSKVICLPLGSGETIRGQRANVVVADEFGCTGYETLVETDQGLMQIGDIIEGKKTDIKVFNKDGNLETPAGSNKTPLTDVYLVTTKYGYTFRCSDRHQVLTAKGWKLGKDLTKDDYLIMDNQYKFPERYIEKDGVVVDEKLAWLMGHIVAGGCITSDEKFRKHLSELGMNYVTNGDKWIPWSILQSPKSVVSAFLSGLFSGGGALFRYHSQKNIWLDALYYTTSERLARELHVLISKFGIIGSRQVCGSKSSDDPQWMLRFDSCHAENLNRVLQTTHTDIDLFITEKTFDLPVESVVKLEQQEHLYDFYLPETHSWRGNSFIQHNSLSAEIFETVVRGFAAVKSDGLFNSVVEAYKRKELGKITGNTEKEENLVATNVKNVLAGNQIIIGGTATYHFNHFYKYFMLYKELILSGGDKNQLKQKFPAMSIPEGDVDASQYAVIRIPAHVLPPGMMDENILAQGQATMDPQIFLQEYCCVFSKDSDGFFLASSLHRATCPVQSTAEGLIDFPATLVGHDDTKYVMGIDPASEDDDFAIGIAAVHDTWQGYVYQWTTNRKDFEEMKRNGWLDPSIHDYHTFCIKHIRNLCRRFNIQMIFLDAGGGGLSIREGLKDPDKLLDSSDTLIYDMDDENSQGLQGRHILKMIEFQNSEWRKKAHYSLKKDILDLKILFPKYDAVAVEMSIVESAGRGVYFDTLDECYLEIEQCKQQTAMIKHTATNTGQEKWDVPRIVGVDAEQIKKTLKRDRFTSLLLTNDAANFYRSENTLSKPKEFVAMGNGMPHNIQFIGRNMGRFKTAPTLNLNE